MCQLISLHKLCRPEGSERTHRTHGKGKPAPQDPLPGKIVIRLGERKNFLGKQKLKAFINTKPTLKQMLKGLF